MLFTKAGYATVYNLNIFTSDQIKDEITARKKLFFWRNFWAAFVTKTFDFLEQILSIF